MERSRVFERPARLGLVSAVGAALVFLATCTADAVEATCRDYTQAQGPNAAVFQGFLYGYTAARMEGRSDPDINAATLRLADMVASYCFRQPDERVLSAVEKLVRLVAAEPKQ
jgi:hypothetical protein